MKLGGNVGVGPTRVCVCLYVCLCVCVHSWSGGSRGMFHYISSTLTPGISSVWEGPDSTPCLNGSGMIVCVFLECSHVSNHTHNTHHKFDSPDERLSLDTKAVKAKATLPFALQLTAPPHEGLSRDPIQITNAEVKPL